MTLDWRKISKDYYYRFRGDNDEEEQKSENIKFLLTQEQDFNTCFKYELTSFISKVNILYEKLKEFEQDPNTIKVVKKIFNIVIIPDEEAETTVFISEMKQGNVLKKYYNEYIHKHTSAYTETSSCIYALNDIQLDDIVTHYNGILDLQDFYKLIFKNDFIDERSFNQVYDKFMCVQTMNLEYDEQTEEEKDVDYFIFRCS